MRGVNLDYGNTCLGCAGGLSMTLVWAVRRIRMAHGCQLQPSTSCLMTCHFQRNTKGKGKKNREKEKKKKKRTRKT